MHPDSLNLAGVRGRFLKSKRHNHRFKEFGVVAALLLTLSIILSGPALASQDSQTQQASHATGKPLTNSDILDMLTAGVSQEVVVAKIAASACEFDTSPAALKQLKAAKVPDAVALAMVQSPDVSHGQEMARAEPSTATRIDCNSAGPVYAYPAPPTSGTIASRTDTAGAFAVNCGDKITLLNPGDKEEGWLKIRTASGQVGYVSSYFVASRERSTESSQEGPPSSESKKKEDAQKANDDLEDCRTRSQNEYDSKMNAISTMALTPTVRVVASNRLKQNLDAELRECRSEYELRLKAMDAK